MSSAELSPQYILVFPVPIERQADEATGLIMMPPPRCRFNLKEEARNTHGCGFRWGKFCEEEETGETEEGDEEERRYTKGKCAALSY